MTEHAKVLGRATKKIIKSCYRSRGHYDNFSATSKIHVTYDENGICLINMLMESHKW